MRFSTFTAGRSSINRPCAAIQDRGGSVAGPQRTAYYYRSISGTHRTRLPLVDLTWPFQSFALDPQLTLSQIHVAPLERTELAAA